MVGSRGFLASLNVAGLVCFWIFEEAWLICGLNEREEGLEKGEGLNNLGRENRHMAPGK